MHFYAHNFVCALLFCTQFRVRALQWASIKFQEYNHIGSLTHFIFARCMHLFNVHTYIFFFFILLQLAASRCVHLFVVVMAPIDRRTSTCRTKIRISILSSSLAIYIEGALIRYIYTIRLFVFAHFGCTRVSVFRVTRDTPRELPHFTIFYYVMSLHVCGWYAVA